MKESKEFNEAIEDLNKAQGLEVVDVEEVVEANKSPFTESKNVPYKKIFNIEGDLANPITKEDPYTNPFMNRREKKAMLKKAYKHPKNNKKGIRLVVTKFAKGKFLKTEVIKQRVEKGYSNPVLHEDGTSSNVDKVYKARTLIHNKANI